MAYLINSETFFLKNRAADSFNQLIVRLRQSVNDVNHQAQRNEADANCLKAFLLLIKALEVHYQKHPKTALQIAKASAIFFDDYQRLRGQCMLNKDTSNLAQSIVNYRQACQQSRVGLAILEAVSLVTLTALTAIGVALIATLMGAHIGFILAGLSGATFAAVLMLSLSAAPALMMGIVTAIETTRDSDWQQRFYPHDEIQGYTDDVIEKAKVMC